MSTSEIIQIVLTSMSFVASIVVSFLVYWLQRKHEKEVNNLEEKRRKVELENKADCFLIDNESEREYLPYCMVANNFHKLDRHTHSIYTNFCRCSEELQTEILKKAEINLPQIQKNEEWLDKCIELLQCDIKKYKLGRDWLYDGAKYFKYCYSKYKNETWENTPVVFDRIKPCSKKSLLPFYTKNIDVGCYIDDYLYYYIDRNADYGDEPPIPPIDYVCKVANFEGTDEKTLCWWIMDIIHQITIVLHNRNLKNSVDEIPCWELPSSISETFEDEYYDTLLWLYYTYWYPNHMPAIEPNQQSKKRQTRKPDVQ